MRARRAASAQWACALMMLACVYSAPAPAHAAPAPNDPVASPADQGDSSTVSTVPCETLLLRNPPPKPSNLVEYEAAAYHAARALSELVERGSLDEAAAAAMARQVARTPLSPPPAAVALGAPQLHVGVLFIAQPPRLVVFQQNNSAALQQFWRTLASAWNVTSVVWSGAWYSCEDRSWWGGTAAARGPWAVRAAAALFRRIPALPCEEAMYDWLGGPPLCDPASTECEAMTTSGISERRLEYRCRCRAGHWRAEPSADAADGAATATGSAAHARLACAACGAGAALCLPDYYRAALLAANLAGCLLTLLTGLVIFRRRKCKAVAMSMWTVLEVILLGGLLMYASAASQYMSSERWRCILGAWLRELGFVACYGSVVLRLWVLLAEFRTRKAHRWTPRDAEVLRVVGAMLIGAACYLAAFTATAACDGDDGAGDAGGCARAAWHHVTAGAELLLLVAGMRIAYAARNANVPFQERGWLAVALGVEAICGVAWRLAALAGAAPERSALAATARAQLSAGTALACVLAPRLWYGYRARSLAQEVSRRGPAEGFGVEGEEEPTQEEVRAELKRLYVQLEILRNKTLRRDNPHISKRRGGRKPPHRRFSLQALQARRGGKGKAGGSASVAEASEAYDASRTPEDSVCSNEGPSHYTDGDTQA